MIRLYSYNIHKGIGGRDRRYRLERIIRVIEDGVPDLICLQEVTRGARRTRHEDQPALLAKRFGSPGQLFQVNVRYKEGGYGNLILSRWPFKSHHQISLRMGKRKPRGAQLVVIDSPKGPFQLVNLHFGLAERERHWQARHLLEHQLFRESADLPTVIAGDSNDWRNTLRKGPFAQHGFVQVTSPPSRFRSFPAYFPLGSLDKAYVRGAIHVEHARVVHTPMARIASDHLPLMIEFRLGKAEAGQP
jgi:endonuclease/exonuclease/phosphatase family metal-dependent hydrolase